MNKTLLLSAGFALSLLALPAAAVGVDNGQLRPPPSAPRAVSSQVAPDHRAWIAPFVVQGDPAVYFARLVQVVKDQPRVRILAQRPGYLHAEFTTPLMRFKDDVEFLLSADGRRVDVRSASRIGYYDFNANRERVESLRLQMAVR